MQNTRTRIRVELLAILLAAAAAGQVTQDPTAASITPKLLQTLPLQEARRSVLQDALGKRDYATAEQLLADEAKQQPNSQPVLVVLANILFLDGQHLNCAIALKKAEKLAPLDERNQFLLALSYVTIGRLDWARPEFEKLARASPSKAVYPYWLSRIDYRKMNARSALQHARKAVQLDPAFMKAYDQLGLCHEALDQWDEAIQAFRDAIRLNRELPAPSPWPSLNLGVLLLRREQLDEAEQHLRDSVRTDDHFPVAHYRLGQLLEKKGRYEEAIAELQRAASLDPTYPEPHYALGRIFRQRNNIKASEKELNLFRELRNADKLKGINRPD